MSTVDANGFTRTRLDERFATLQAAVQAIFGPDINLDPDSIDGETLGIYAGAIADLDQLAEDCYQGFNPQSATGLALSRLVQLNAIRRIAGAYSTASLLAVGTQGTLIPAGSLVGSTTLPIVFETIADALIDNTGQVAIAARASDFGATLAPAGTLNKISTPIYGWQTITNPVDAIPGRNEESDEELRIRRAQSTATPAQSIVDGIYGAIANLSGVRHAKVYENDTDTVNATGQAPHSIYAIVDGGADADIAQQIYLRKTVGTTSLGASSYPVNDTQGFVHTIRFGRPVDVLVYCTVRLHKRAGYPSDGDARIKAALLDWVVANQDIGQELIQSKLYIPVNTIPGHSVDSIAIALTADPTATANIAIAYNAIARFDSTRINVISI